MSRISAYVDASMFHAAFRMRHNDEYRDARAKRADEGLFLNLLHNILLYDSLLVSDACANYLKSVHSQVREIAELINEFCDDPIVEAMAVYTKLSDSELVRRIASNLFRLATDSKSAKELARWNVPLAYKSRKHYHYDNLMALCCEESFPTEFVPFVTYCLSGVVYSGIAHNLRDPKYGDVVYVAAPGRIAALEQILTADEVNTFGTPQVAYEELAREIHLPNKGMVFHHISTSLPPAETSPLIDTLLSKPPIDALRWVCKARGQEEYVRIREDWPNLLMDRGTAVNVGSPIQNVTDATIHGDLVMVIGTSKDA